MLLNSRRIGQFITLSSQVHVKALRLVVPTLSYWSHCWFDGRASWRSFSTIHLQSYSLRQLCYTLFSGCQLLCPLSNWVWVWLLMYALYSLNGIMFHCVFHSIFCIREMRLLYSLHASCWRQWHRQLQVSFQLWENGIILINCLFHRSPKI